jgi:hypothetical protein
MKIPFLKFLMLSGIVAATWNCSESAATQDSASKSANGTLDVQIPQNIVVSEPSYFFQKGTSHYVIAPSTMTISDGSGKVIGTFNLSTGAIISLSGEIIAINIDLSKLPIVAPSRLSIKL